MKKLLSFFGCILFTLTVSAQVPESFSYQAVVRDAGGNVVANQNVSIQIVITEGALPGTVVYSETHSVVTNGFGLVNLQIGTGIPDIGSFPAIDWSGGLFYVRTKADITGGTNYVDLGASQLLSVPFALYSKSTSSTGGHWAANGDDIHNTNIGKVGVGTDTPPAKLVVQGDSSMADTVPLFEVKDKSGYTVFIVYPDSARFYLGDDGSKSNKGTFAVSGRNTAKAFTNDFLKVTPDYSRVYTGDPMLGFGVENIGVSSNESYMRLTPENYFIGHEAGVNTVLGAGLSGKYNVFLGYYSGRTNINGHSNVFLGYSAGQSNQFGYNNIYIGDSSGYSNSGGYDNVYIGKNTGKNGTAGQYNVFIGSKAGQENLTGSLNTFFGNRSGSKNISGSYNTYMGNQAGDENTSGSHNIFLGSAAGFMSGGSSYNIFIGNNAGSNSIGERNIFIGTGMGSYVADSNKLMIDAYNSTQPLLYGDFNDRYLTINGKVGVGMEPVVELDINGGMRLGYTGLASAGAIRWSGSDFEGYNGTAWQSFTAIGNRYSLDAFDGSPTEVVFVDAAGNVGINITTGMTHALNILSSTNKNIWLRGSLNAVEAGGKINFGDGNFTYIQETSDDTLSIYADRMVSITGNVSAFKTGIGTNAPTSLLHVNGSFATSVKKVTASVFLGLADQTVFVDNSSVVSVTLPSASGIAGRIYTVKKISNNVFAVNVSSPSLIDGLATRALTVQYQYVTLVSDGTTWYITSEN